MVSEEPTRKMIAELGSAGWSVIRTGGRHTVYGCGCGKHTAPLPQSHKTISPGVVRSIRNSIKACKAEQKKELKR